MHTLCASHFDSCLIGWCLAGWRLAAQASPGSWNCCMSDAQMQQRSATRRFIFQGG